MTGDVLRLQSLAVGAKKLFMVNEVLYCLHIHLLSILQDESRVGIIVLDPTNVLKIPRVSKTGENVSGSNSRFAVEC